MQKQIVCEAQLIYSTTGLDNIESQMKAINRYFLNEIKPKSFNPEDPENDLVLHEQQFYQLCSMLETNAVENPEKKSVVDVYSRLSYFKKKVSNIKKKE